MNVKRSILGIIAFGLTAFYIPKIIGFEKPDHFPEPIYNFENNPVSKEKIMLGRALFHDPILSKDNTISCTSCHSSYGAFAHQDHELSHGIRDQIGTRNAPALMNLAWQNLFNWDGAVNHLDMQALAPINHPGEMDETTENVIRKLQSSSIYPTLFYKAYGDSAVTTERMLKALSQFQLTFISSNSKYDQVKRKEVKFTKQEKSGYKLFKKNCNSCHQEPLFSTYQFANNGLPVDTSLNDFGRWKITKQSNDSLLFKIPTLRNLSHTRPHMHDGRFSSFIEVLDHYTDGIVQHPTLSNELQKPIRLSSNEKTDLITFLVTLNDKEFVFNPEFQYPKDVLKP